jgi:hypothetical protein
MISVTAAQRAALKEHVQLNTLCKFRIGTTWYYITNNDTETVYGGNTYSPGYLLDVDDIEINSTPKVEDSDIVIDGNDSIFTGLLLSQNWMNNPLQIIQLYNDKNGDLIRAEIAYDGLLSDVSIDTSGSYEITLTVSSIWKDFEKQAGIKTNSTSQNIHYPNDTGFEHTAKATKSVPWGKSGNGRSSLGTTEIEFGRFNTPVEP